jgi:predicted GNAT family acetyltransferase
MDTGIAVEHQPGRCRFEISLPEGRCELDYLLQDGVMSLVHTGVPPALEGRGLAAALVRAALAHARAQGWRVRTPCSYAAAYARRHPGEMPPG